MTDSFTDVCVLKASTTSTHVPDESAWVPDDETVIGNVGEYDAARADERPATDRHSGEQDAPGPHRCSESDPYRGSAPVCAALESAVRPYRSGNAVVRHNHTRTEEHSILQHCRMVDASAVLQLAVVAHHDVEVNVYALPKYTTGAYRRVFSHLGVMPDRGARGDTGFGGNVGGRVDHVSILPSSGAGPSTGKRRSKV